MNKRPVIAIEGIDGAGKTTVAKLLADKIGGIYYKTPPEKFHECRALFEDNSHESLSRFFFYLSILWDSWNKINKLSRKTPVIVDRYLLSTKIYHEALLTKQPEMRKIIEKYFQVISPPNPDFNIILKISPREAEKRLTLSGKGNLFDIKIEQDRKLQEEISRRFYATSNNVFFINVFGKTPEGIVEECKKVIC